LTWWFILIYIDNSPETLETFFCAFRAEAAAPQESWRCFSELVIDQKALQGKVVA